MSVKKIKCPHCSTILAQGADICCQPLRDELNLLATKQGATLDNLTKAFNKWFKDHEVKDADQTTV